MNDIESVIQAACKELFNVDVLVELSRPDEQFGDYATNVALKLAKELNKSPREIAEAISSELSAGGHGFKAVTVAGPGFINITLSDKQLIRLVLNKKKFLPLEGQEVLVEFGDPNPLKAMHLGHLYTTIIGDTIARLHETAGADVRRLSYHGDVGMHVAKAVWAIGEYIDWDISRLPELEQETVKIDDQLLNLKTIIGYLYAVGAQAFDEESGAAEQIRAINASVYKKDRPEIQAIYEWGVERSFAYFDLIFSELEVQYDKRYLESQSAPVGLERVKAQTGTVFEESSGAIVYRGEKHGLHTRVFVSSEGLPTYEAKDLGLAELKARDFPKTSKSIIITANEQAEYFKVMLAALGEIKPELADKTTHIAHGFLSLTTGKMSSRTGNVFGAQSLMDDTRAAVAKAFPDSDVQREVYLAALKYTFLKNRIGGDIIFNVQESVSLEGNSGPYLQYAHARARSILQKVGDIKDTELTEVENDERSLLRKLSEYPEAIARAVDELMPHHVCTYLYELAQEFNRFYEHNRVLDDPRQAVRCRIVSVYADTLEQGLDLLGVPAPAHM